MTRSKAPRSGFSLPAVLAVTGMVTLIFLVAMTALRSLTAEAASARARVRFLTRALTAEAAMTYMVATEPIAPSGVNVGGPRLIGDEAFGVAISDDLVRLDGRRYRGDFDGPLLIRLQDQAGLANLAYLSDAASQRFGQALGLSARSARALGPLYRDYIDQDALKQINGAEGDDYGRDGPANRTMRRPQEALSLLGVRTGADAGAWRRLRPDLAMDSTSPNENVNTATAGALQILYGATPAQAEAAIRTREQRPFTSFSDFAGVTGLADTTGEGFYTYPSGRIVTTIADGRSAWVYRFRLTLTPSGVERPVWIDQTELKEAPGRAKADLSDAVRLSYPAR